MQKIFLLECATINKIAFFKTSCLGLSLSNSNHEQYDFGFLQKVSKGIHCRDWPTARQSTEHTVVDVQKSNIDDAAFCIDHDGIYSPWRLGPPPP